jgi:hypothetical protein
MLGCAPLAPSPAERDWLRACGIGWPLAAWTLDQLARAALLVLAVERLPERQGVALVDDCYRRGDVRERQAVLRALPLLSGAHRFLDVALAAARTNLQPDFEALAAENPYPAAHFPQDAFNELVLKALSVGLPLGRIVALRDRVTPELVRRAADFARERAAAGRPVPPDVERLLAGWPSAA